MARVLAACVACLALLAGASVPASAAVDSEIDDCLEATPRAVAVPGGLPIELRVFVLLDGVTASDGRGVMAAAAAAYKPVGINLTVAGYKPVSFAPVDPAALIEASRTTVGGARPEWTHLVYTLTSKDMDAGGATGTAVAGQADCIGGVAFPDSSFAVGEAGDAGYAPLIAAHELGHLMGAHHHYANCAESLTEIFPPCTLMINDVGLATMHFSTLNSAIVRGHAEKWATPLPPVPRPTPQASPTPDPPSEPDPGPAAPVEPSAPAAVPTASAGTSHACASARRALGHARAAERRARPARTRSARRRVARRRAAVRRARLRVQRSCA